MNSRVTPTQKLEYMKRIVQVFLQKNDIKLLYTKKIKRCFLTGTTFNGRFMYQLGSEDCTVIDFLNDSISNFIHSPQK
jgi:hypothetical protein